MNSVKARKLSMAAPARCSVCLVDKASGIAYTLPIAIYDEAGLAARLHGFATICGSCKSDIDGAELDVTSEDQYQDFLARTEETLDALLEDSFPPILKRGFTFSKD